MAAVAAFQAAAGFALIWHFRSLGGAGDDARYLAWTSAATIAVWPLWRVLSEVSDRLEKAKAEKEAGPPPKERPGR